MREIIWTIITIIISTSTSSLASNRVTLKWDPSNPNPTGYSLFMRTKEQAYNYNNPVITSKYPDGLIPHPSISTMIINVPAGTYYFVCRAYLKKDDGSIIWSGDSNEVTWTSDGTSPISIQIKQPDDIRYVKD